MVKRSFDVIAAVCGSVLVSPLLLLLSVLVRVTSGHPVIFRQKRVGRGGREFVLYKFRTMTVAEEKEQGSFDAGDVSRVTRLGKFLRDSKMDELPQLWNVVKGDMALVGPRPEVREWVDAYPEKWAVVHGVRPGITDPASIFYRHEERLLAESDDPEATYRNEILPHKLDLYGQYVHNCTFRGDLAILLRTLFPGKHREASGDARSGGGVGRRS
jgi:lipopolysaccharide/colanic/teichoic acid biosynthesis glycosyltransferase